MPGTTASASSYASTTTSWSMLMPLASTPTRPIAARTFEIRELAPRTKTREGSTTTGPTSMPSGIGPGLDRDGDAARDDVIDADVHAAGRVVDDADARVDGDERRPAR